MPSVKTNYYRCVLCSKETKANERRKVNASIRRFLRKTFLTESTCDDVICNKCRHKYYNSEKRKKENEIENVTISSNESSDEDISPPPTKKKNILNSPPSVSLPIPSTSTSHAYCFICKRPGPKLVVLPSECKTRVFVHQNILIPAGARCCPIHLEDNALTTDSITKMKTIYDESRLNRTTIVEMLRRMQGICKKLEKSRLDFDSRHALTDDDYIELTGLSKLNFDDVCNNIKDFVKNTPVRSHRCSCAIFFCKMKSGLSNKFLSTLFNISKSSVRRAIAIVRKALISTLVPDHLGFNHLTRESLISDHTRPLAQSLLGDFGEQKAILVLDGTYIYIEKSNNFYFQRRSFSVHKGRPLVKPMVITSTTGYFVSILGPYFADSKNNDASILNHILRNNVEDIKSWVHEDDIFVVDRGFRDSLSLLDDLGIKAEMPRFLFKGQKQMSTDDANMSRLVTKVRWVVESANARIKRWKFLSRTLPTNQVPFIGDYVRIVCAVCNKFFPPLNSTTDPDADESEAAKMRYLSHSVNELKEYLEKHQMIRKSTPWKPINDDDLLDFPNIDDEQLRNITCGTYQLKLSPSYIQEHIDGESDIFIHKEDPTLIRVKIQSRHTSSKRYTVWIRYSPEEVQAWYCLCRAGARVVGVCAHVAAILWYLGSARWSEKVSFGVRNWGQSLADAGELPEAIDQSDSDSEESVIEE